MWYPNDVVVDDSGNIYTVDDRNYRVQKKQISPEIVVEAGETTGTLTITAVSDSSDEGDETLILTPQTPITVSYTHLTLPTKA